MMVYCFHPMFTVEYKYLDVRYLPGCTYMTQLMDIRVMRMGAYQVIRKAVLQTNLTRFED